MTATYGGCDGLIFFIFYCKILKNIISDKDAHPNPCDSNNGGCGSKICSWQLGDEEQKCTAPPKKPAPMPEKGSSVTEWCSTNLHDFYGTDSDVMGYV